METQGLCVRAVHSLLTGHLAALVLLAPIFQVGTKCGPSVPCVRNGHLMKLGVHTGWPGYLPHLFSGERLREKPSRSNVNPLSLGGEGEGPWSLLP